MTPRRPPGPISPPVAKILSGPSAIAAQRKLSQTEQRKQEWPYPTSFPPPQSVRVNVEGSIVAPAVGVQTLVLQYQVPDGFQFAFTHLINLYSGAGFILGAPSITWVVDVNNSIPAVAGGQAQGYPVQGISPSFIPKGGTGGISSAPGPGVFAPWELSKPEMLKPSDILRSKVTTTAAITPGAPNYFIAIFIGWIWETTV